MANIGRFFAGFGRFGCAHQSTSFGEEYSLLALSTIPGVDHNYFTYSVNEALHLSPKEEATLLSLYQTIESEYNNNQDELSREIILGLLDTLLKYANRFYKRQFIHRAQIQGQLSQRLHQVLINYFATGAAYQSGMPTVEWAANALSMSPRYLSDALKTETHKTAIEHIHWFLLDEAKNLLLDPQKTVAEVAYQLGFEYPQYFSRLFKRKVGMSPSDFQKSNAP
ncbi:helix-turn-helix domain-containing protein [Thiofilum flexile]|uniref:helix-turn-helix domain-containing protein n=1 Tax=Thiofilum flexile TaxID=125627 RepID=UPI00037C9540|nr:response regulator transcription factor [Thiofilum flexile]